MNAVAVELLAVLHCEAVFSGSQQFRSRHTRWLNQTFVIQTVLSTLLIKNSIWCAVLMVWHKLI